MPLVRDASWLGGSCNHITGRALLGARPLDAQASGHEGSLLTDPGGNVLKVSVGAERHAYEELVRRQDALYRCVPRYLGMVRVQGRSEEFLCLQNLLGGMANPHIMDCKIGTRTFLESECSNAKLRADLYQKLVRLDPNLPTAEERAAGAVTKLRYMLAREQRSSSSSLGFRVDGMARPPGRVRAFLQRRSSWDREGDLGHLRDPRDVAAVFARWVRRAAPGRAREAVRQLRIHLHTVADTLRESEFFASHEFIGTSLLFAVDSKAKAGAWIIDLAKVLPLPEGVRIDHVSNWREGNHEDGYLKGLAAMERAWADADSILQEFGEPPAQQPGPPPLSLPAPRPEAAGEPCNDSAPPAPAPAPAAPAETAPAAPAETAPAAPAEAAPAAPAEAALAAPAEAVPGAAAGAGQTAGAAAPPSGEAAGQPAELQRLYCDPADAGTALTEDSPATEPAPETDRQPG
eukprot:TRINITY_DN11623_c0_g2_i1.p1 TRINITY_DN11623_c0_g2~~TRINITY_DN11623_c0_g2_i1.p1  ORF type:complete len:487 (+),score=114.70 TRINITY_DN11623_c0_g2_i1:79-1461(+)